MNKHFNNYSLYSHYNFIKCTCSVYAGFHYYLLILSLNYVKKAISFCYCFWKLCFIDREAYFKCQFAFWNITVFYFSYLPFVNFDTIENHVHPLHIIETRSLFFPLKPFRIHQRKISYKKDCWSVNLKSKNKKILDVACNNTVTIPLITDKK